VKVFFFSFFHSFLLCTPFYLLRDERERTNQKKTCSLSLCLSWLPFFLCEVVGGGDWSDWCCNLGQFGTSCLCVLRRARGNCCLCVFFI
jgi:hypothetical protein